jgi:hypothetical protein
MVDEIQENVDALSNDVPKRVYLNAAFKETIIELIVEFKKGTMKYNWNECEVVYKLLFIGQKMAVVFNKNLEEKMEWAYQQFALNIVIHSLLVYHQASVNKLKSANANEKGEELQGMAELWPIGMTIKEEEETTGHVAEFIGMIEKIK